jgi:hypothetical protein
MTMFSKPIGELLQEAGLISRAQLQVALHEQTEYCTLRLGEICALHGWVKQQTADFFVEYWPQLVSERHTTAFSLGQYLQSAGLLDEQQIDVLLKEQWQTGVRIGSLAVLKGWLKQDTLNFLLKHIAPNETTKSAFVKKQRTAQDESNAQMQDHPPSTEEVKWIG